MPDAVTFKVTTYRKLAKGETGPTQVGSVRLPASAALDWILRSLPEDAVTFSWPDGNQSVRIDIDWLKVPESVRWPKIPASRR
jgi:hypothetical protein